MAKSNLRIIILFFFSVGGQQIMNHEKLCIQYTKGKLIIYVATNYSIHDITCMQINPMKSDWLYCIAGNGSKG